MLQNELDDLLSELDTIKQRIKFYQEVQDKADQQKRHKAWHRAHDKLELYYDEKFSLQLRIDAIEEMLGNTEAKEVQSAYFWGVR